MRQAVTLIMALLLVAGVAIAKDGGKDRLLEPVFDQPSTLLSTQGIASGWNQIPLELSTSAYIYVDYMPTGVAWIAGYQTAGTPAQNFGYRTTDDGATWSRFVITNTTVRPGVCNITAKDDQTAMVGFYTGEIMRTTNGGSTWDTVYQYGDKSQYINWIKFVDANTVIAIGDADASGIMVARSTDAGATWTRETFAPDADSLTAGVYWASLASLGQAGDVYGNNVWTTWYYGSTEQPLIMHSTDLGVTWEKWRAGLPDLANNYYFRSINFLDENTAFAVTRGFGTDTYIYFKSVDGGHTWTKMPEMQAGPTHTSQRPYSVRPIRGTANVVAVGYNGTSGQTAPKTWWSSDSGATFVPYYAPPGPGIGSLVHSSFISPTKGLIVGYKNVLSYIPQYPVTFRVNMKVKILEGSFANGTDVVTVRGSFNDWGNSTPASGDTLLQLAAPNDSIYAKTILLSSAGDINYKFWSSASVLGWEGDPNRTYTVVEGGGVIPVVYFNRDSVVSLPTNVTFQVNMRVKLLEGTFNKSTGSVTVRGSFNDWGNSTNNPDTLHALTAPDDSIYAITKSLMSGDPLAYKFWATGLDYETGSNRNWTVQSGAQTIPWDYFDRDTVVNVPVSTNILWSTNMRAMITLGWFDPGVDQMQVRGDFEGWSGTAIDPDLLNPELYSKALPYNGTVGDIKSYKFYMKLDSAAAVAKWGADFTSNQDGYKYEHPAERGDGNNQYTIVNSPTQQPATSFYAGINPAGLLGANDSVNVTLTVNMTPAKSYLANPFNPATDTVFVVFQDALWRGSQRTVQGTFPSPLQAAPNGTGDQFAVTFKVKGKTHYNMQYTWRYVNGTGTVDQGGGLGGQNPYITRFIRQAVQGVWPAAYSAPMDTWQKDAPLPGETAQYTTGIPEVGNSGKPLVFSLDQNYPNPFNPSTEIRYSIPEAGLVSLKVFNVLGQEVATLVNETRPAGKYVSLFEARTLASGVYFYKLEAGKFSQVRKMLLLK